MSERSDTSHQSAVEDAMPAYWDASSDAMPDDVRPGYKRAEVGVIPESWKVVPVEDIAEIRSGGTPSTHNQAFWNGDVPWCTPTDITALADRKYLTETDRTISSEGLRASSAEVIPPKSIIMTTRATIGECAINTVAMTTNQGFKNLVPTRADAEFLYYSMASKKRQLIELCGGSTFLEIGKKQLRRVKVAVPASIEEQRAIATALSDADALIESLDRLIAKKRAIKQAAMQQLLSGETRLPGFEGSWDTVRLGECVSIRNSKVMPSRVSPQTHGIELEHIGQGDGQLLMHATAAELTASKYQFVKGDVLFGRLRSYLRKFWWADRDGICTTEIWPLAADGRVMVAEYLYLMVQTKEFVDASSISYGTHMPRADWKVMRNLEIRLPGLEEQEAIANVVLDMESELTLLQRRRDKAKQIKQGMMQELLTGRTRLVNPEAA